MANLSRGKSQQTASTSTTMMKLNFELCTVVLSPVRTKQISTSLWYPSSAVLKWRLELPDIRRAAAQAVKRQFIEEAVKINMVKSGAEFAEDDDVWLDEPPSEVESENEDEELEAPAV